MPFRPCPDSQITVDQPVFHVHRKPAKCAGFFLFKSARFRKYRFKTKIVEGIGAISTGTSKTHIRPGTFYVGETIMGDRGSGHPLFIKGDDL